MVLVVKNGRLCFDERLLLRIRQRDNDQVRSILANVDLCKTSDSSGATLLHVASQYGNANVARYLIDSGVDVDSQDDYGRTPLLLAVTRNRAEISTETIDVLLEAGADLLMADVHGKYPLQQVVDSKAFHVLAVVKKFLKRLRVDCRDDRESLAEQLIKADCPLERVVYLGNASVTETMIKAGYLVNEPHPRYGHTALHVAATIMDLENVKVLLKHGADVTARIGRRLLPLSMYFIAGKYRAHLQNAQIMKLLMNENFRATNSIEDIELSVRHALQMGDEETVGHVLRYGVDFSVRGNYDNTYLHYLAMNDNPNVAKAFESSRISRDVNARNVRGCTPLHYAVVARNLSTVRIFLDGGANVDDRSLMGNTPLSALFFTLSERLHPDEKAIVELLLQHDADIQIVIPASDGLRETIFDYVARNERFDLGEPLLAKLAFREKLGEPVVDLIRRKIDAHETLKNYYDLCGRQLEEMKTIVIYESITLFKLLCQSEKEIIRRNAYNRDLLDELKDFGAKYSLNSHYFDILRARVASALPKIQLVQNVTSVIFDLLGPQLKRNYLIVRNIIDCLNYQDMKVLSAMKID